MSDVGPEAEIAGAEQDPPPELARSVELVRRLQGGDREACDELLARYRPRLVRIVRVKLGPSLRSRLDEEDIVQEALLIAAGRLGAFELRTHAGILHWFAKIAENVILRRRGHHEAEMRDPGRELRADGRPDDTRAALDPAASGTTPSQGAARAELEALVDAHVQALEPPEYRAVILHRDYYLEEWEEIRRAMGRPTVGAVQELHRRAHQRLRERLRKHIEGS